MAKKTQTQSELKTNPKTKGSEVLKSTANSAKEESSKEAKPKASGKKTAAIKTEAKKKAAPAAAKIKAVKADVDKKEIKSTKATKQASKMDAEKDIKKPVKAVKIEEKKSDIKPEPKVKTIKAPQTKITDKIKKAQVKTPAKKKAAAVKPKADIAGSANINEEEKISQTKFELEHPAIFIEPKHPLEETRELPDSYGETKIIALIRDPEWVFTYWDISEDTRIRFNIPKGNHSRDMALRIYDVTDVNFDGNNAISWFDIQINDYSISWYLRIPEAGRSYIIDIGVYSDSGIFQTIARSNSFKMPIAEISQHTDEEWMNVTEETFMELFRLSGGLSSREFKGSENIIRLLNERMRNWLFSGSLSSGAVASQQNVEKKNKGFWLIADAELIIYGATDPSAKVSVQKIPIKLNQQGTFSLRFALPDGVQEIPVVAVNADGDDTRQIVITVKRKTS